MIGVVLVDDQELARAGLRSILRAAYGFEVVGEAGDGDECVAAVGRSIIFAFDHGVVRPGEPGPIPPE